jgi:hypothetical protein
MGNGVDMLTAAVLGPAVFVALLLLGAVLAGIVAVLVIVVVANRAEPDETKRRPFAVYLFGTSFLAIWIAFVGTIAVVVSLVSLLGSGGSRVMPAFGSIALHPVGDSVVRGATLGGIVAIIGTVLVVTHLRRGLAIADPESGGPASRVAQSYVAATAFVSVFVLLFALIVAIYAVCQLIAPGTYAAASRTNAGRTLIDSGYIALGSLTILFSHLRFVPRSLWPRVRSAHTTPE